ASPLAMSIFYVSFIYLVFPEIIPRFALYTILGGSALLLVPVLVAPLHIYAHVLTPMSLLIVCGGFWLWIGTLIAMLRGNRDAYLAFPGLLCFIIGGVNDILYSHLIINTGYFMQYGILVFMFSQSLIISRR